MTTKTPEPTDLIRLAFKPADLQTLIDALSDTSDPKVARVYHRLQMRLASHAVKASS